MLSFHVRRCCYTGWQEVSIPELVRKIPVQRVKGVLSLLYFGGVAVSGLYGAVRGLGDFDQWSRHTVPRKMANKTLEPSA